MIKLDKIVATYTTQRGQVNAVDGVTLTLPNDLILGIAGKVGPTLAQMAKACRTAEAPSPTVASTVSVGQARASSACRACASRGSSSAIRAVAACIDQAVFVLVGRCSSTVVPWPGVELRSTEPFSP